MRYIFNSLSDRVIRLPVVPTVRLHIQIRAKPCTGCGFDLIPGHVCRWKML